MSRMRGGGGATPQKGDIIMEDANSRPLDRFGREIHIGDAVFAGIPYRFMLVESFRQVNDRGEIFTFVKLRGWPEPATPASLEVISGEQDLNDPRWDDRRTFCKFHPHAEWRKFQRRLERRRA